MIVVAKRQGKEKGTFTLQICLLTPYAPRKSALRICSPALTTIVVNEYRAHLNSRAHQMALNGISSNMNGLHGMHAFVEPPPPPPEAAAPPPPPDSFDPPPPPEDFPPPPPPPTVNGTALSEGQSETKKRKKGWGEATSKKQPLSVEELLRKKKEADEAASKVRALSIQRILLYKTCEHTDSRSIAQIPHKDATREACTRKARKRCGRRKKEAESPRGLEAGCEERRHNFQPISP